MRTIEQHPFYLRDNKGILDSHTSEDSYEYRPGLVEQVVELLQSWFFRG